MEYWIDQYGDYTFCDGDAGIDIPNHEMVVVQECFTKLIDIWASHDDTLLECLVELAQPFIESEHGFTDTCLFRTSINDSIDNWLAENIITQAESDDIYGTILDRLQMRYTIAELLSMNYDEVLHIAIGHFDGDPRQFAVDNWNWIRVIHKNFDVKAITPDTCRRMELFVESDEGQDIATRLSRRDKEFKVWNIEVQTPHTYIETKHFSYRYLRSIVQQKRREKQLQ